MAIATFIPSKLVLSQVNGTAVIDFDTDTLKLMIVQAGAGIPSTSKTGIQFVSDVTATNTEVSGTGYSRQTLASVTLAFGSGNDVDFGFGAITFAQNAAGFSNGRYGVGFKEVGGSDATRVVFGILDFNQTVTVVPGDLVLSAPTGGLIQWTTTP